MPTVKTYTVYKFHELSPKAKDKAVERLSNINMDCGQAWENTAYDAELIGLKITSLDDHRANKGHFMESARECADLIIKNHGACCKTHETAKTFLKERNKAVDDAARDNNGDFEDELTLDEKLDEIEVEFLKSILEDYRIKLNEDLEYLSSQEAIIETIEANEYDFTAEGQIDA